MEKNLIAIAIDGPAAAGKSTVAKIVAHRLSYVYIDTGAMYRALTLQALREGVDVHNENELYQLLMTEDIVLQQQSDGQHVYMKQNDVSFDIRSDAVSNSVSIVAAHPSIRAEMVNRQQILASKRGVVMDGRDIGTHVIPDAEVKIFLVASAEERAKRRYEENIDKGIKTSLETLKKEIQERDSIDSKRAVSPLIKAEGAVEIDTTNLNAHEVADKIMQHIPKNA